MSVDATEFIPKVIKHLPAEWLWYKCFISNTVLEEETRIQICLYPPLSKAKNNHCHKKKASPCSI